jgi:hypothetical protein
VERRVGADVGEEFCAERGGVFAGEAHRGRS